MRSDCLLHKSEQWNYLCPCPFHCLMFTCYLRYIRYARACSHFTDSIYRGKRLTQNLIQQSYKDERLKFIPHRFNIITNWFTDTMRWYLNSLATYFCSVIPLGFSIVVCSVILPIVSDSRLRIVRSVDSQHDEKGNLLFKVEFTQIKLQIGQRCGNRTNLENSASISLDIVNK